MSIFYAFHVVTEHRMHLGQHIIFDENHHNGVYKRVMDKLPVVNDIYASGFAGVSAGGGQSKEIPLLSVKNGMFICI